MSIRMATNSLMVIICLIQYEKLFNIEYMNNNFFRIKLILLSCLIFSCSVKNIIPYGAWESILIENRSSLFAKTLPDYSEREVLLTFSENNKFTWINKKDKLSLSGEFTVTGNKIYFKIYGGEKPLETEFSLYDNKLVIITDDGFRFTFVKTD